MVCSCPRFDCIFFLPTRLPFFLCVSYCVSQNRTYPVRTLGVPPSLFTFPPLKFVRGVPSEVDRSHVCPMKRLKVVFVDVLQSLLYPPLIFGYPPNSWLFLSHQFRPILRPVPFFLLRDAHISGPPQESLTKSKCSGKPLGGPLGYFPSNPSNQGLLKDGLFVRKRPHPAKVGFVAFPPHIRTAGFVYLFETVGSRIGGMARNGLPEPTSRKCIRVALSSIYLFVRFRHQTVFFAIDLLANSLEFLVILPVNLPTLHKAKTEPLFRFPFEQLM